MRTLKGVTRRIIELWFVGLETQEQIAQGIGVSQSQISRLLFWIFCDL